MTTALILAAGLGQRLRTVTDGPKWLVEIDGRTPAGQQLAACTDAPVDRMVVVASPGVEPIEAIVDVYRSGLAIEIIENPDSARWNNWSSALVGLEHVEAGEPVLLMNSDVFAARDWFVDGISRLADHDQPALLIDTAKALTDEAMKVAMTGDRVTAIGKVGVADPVGEYVGLAWWPAWHRESITELLSAYRHDPAAAQNWYEHAIAQDMDKGTPYRLVTTSSSDWVEIDDPTDVEVARAIRV